MVSVWKQIRHSILVAFQTESIDTRSDVKNDMNLTINMNWKLELSWHRLIYSWSEGQRRQKENFKVRISFVRAWLLEVWTFGGANPQHARLLIRSAVIWESVRVPKNPNWDLYGDFSVRLSHHLSMLQYGNCLSSYPTIPSYCVRPSFVFYYLIHYKIRLYDLFRL
jgi:hypothetical protein